MINPVVKYRLGRQRLATKLQKDLSNGTVNKIANYNIPPAFNSSIVKLIEINTLSNIIDIFKTTAQISVSDRFKRTKLSLLSFQMSTV